MKQHGQPAREGGGRTADLLVVAQVALSIVLVVAAGLFVRTFTSLATRDLGFARESILLARIDSQRAVADLERRMAVYERVREIVAAQPNVAEAALSVITPVSNMVMDPPVSVSGTNVASTRVYNNAVSAHWLEVYGIPVVAGRGLLDTDGLGTTPVAVVNKAFARRFFGASSPIDQFITLPELMVRPSPNVPLRIVGVVADAVYVRLRELPQPTMYMPMVQHSNPFFAGSYSAVNLNIRARAGSPSQLARGVAAAIASVNPRLEVTFRSLSDQISDALARERVLALLAGFFGVLAMLLAALGLYGVTTYAVIRRRGEIAIRMALGATPSGIMRMVLSHAAAYVFHDPLSSADIVPGFKDYVQQCRLYATLQRSWFGEIVRCLDSAAQGWMVKIAETHGAALIDFARVARRGSVKVKYGLQLQNWQLKAFAVRNSDGDRITVEQVFEEIRNAVDVSPAAKLTADRGRGFRSFSLNIKRSRDERYDQSVWARDIAKTLRLLEPLGEMESVRS